MKKFIDISWPIQKGMVEYKDVAVFDTIPVKKFATHQLFQTELHMSSHTGTHIDFPYHVFADGKRSQAFDSIIGNCVILDLTTVKEAVTQADLQQFSIKQGDIVLLKTKNSFLSATGFFNYDFIYLDESGAQYLAGQQVRAVGIDYLGLERDQQGHPSHEALLRHNIPIIEGLRLESVVATAQYVLYCFPLKIVDTEAAPCRAMLEVLE